MTSSAPGMSSELMPIERTTDSVRALLCVDSSSFTQDHDEVWYVCRFWAALFDNCIISIPGAYISRYILLMIDLYVRANNHRSEVSTRSTAARKNLDSTKRRRAGPLFDGTISVHDQELGAFEHGRTWTDETDRKWVADSRKVVKALHDMLHRLQRPDIQVAGIVTAAWHCQMLRMVYGGGYCCVLAADKVHQVPTPQQDIELLLELIAVAWMMQVRFRPFFLFSIGLQRIIGSVTRIHGEHGESTGPSPQLDESQGSNGCNAVRSADPAVCRNR